ncbi:MAG: TolC family protein [Planctomycetota bacterium]
MKRKNREGLFALVSGSLLVSGCALPAEFRIPMMPSRKAAAESQEESNEFRVASFRSVTYDDPVPSGVPVVAEWASAAKKVEELRQESTGVASEVVKAASDASPIDPLPELPTLAAMDSVSPEEQALPDPLRANESISAMEIDLASALATIGGRHPAVGIARWRVEEAYARLDQAKILWVPTLNAGLSYHRHDGNYQASNGDIVDVNRNSLQAGLGALATGAGTTQRPGVVAEYHLADAIFQPDMTEKQAWASQHAADGVNQRQILQAALDYQRWLAAHLDYQIVQEALERTTELAKLTGDFAATGQGLRADADRLQTELALIEGRLLESNEQVDVSGARLIETLSLPRGQQIIPREPTIAPVEFVAMAMDKSQLIETALASRPELRESRALVAAACAAHRRQKWAPFVPSVLLGFSSSGFGGGLGNNLDNVDGRYDFDAAITWQARQLGLGEAAARRETSSRVQQARFEAARVMDQVAREVTEFYSQIQHRTKRIELSQRATQSAKDSYDRNLSRIRDGQGLPIETLQSLQALEQSQRAYVQAVLEYNEAQFQLQWALGWSVTGE